MENLREAAALESSPAWVKDSWQTLQNEYSFTGFDIPEAAHERFAREFEAYAREGKAPSSQLAAAFRQFGNWLTGIYRSVQKLMGQGEISPEVREVFERLLATEEEIEAAREGSGVRAMFEDAPGLMPQELGGRYQKAVEAARQKAESIIMVRRLAEQRKAEKAFKPEAQEAVNARPFYRMEGDLREAGGISWASALEELHEDLAWDLRRKDAYTRAEDYLDEMGWLVYGKWGPANPAFIRSREPLRQLYDLLEHYPNHPLTKHALEVLNCVLRWCANTSYNTPGPISGKADGTAPEGVFYPKISLELLPIKTQQDVPKEWRAPLVPAKAEGAMEP